MILYIRNIDYIDIFATSKKGYTIKNNINDISVFARSCQIMLSIINLIRRDIQHILSAYLILSRFGRPPPPPAPAPHGSPPCGGEWVWVASVPPLMRGCGCGLLPPSLWYGVVRVRFLAVSPLPALWRGGGLGSAPLYD